MECKWGATLSDGQIIYQDDSHGSGWIRLSEYITANPSIKIIGLSVHRDSTSQYLPTQQSAYYFSKGIISVLQGNSIEYYVLGWLPPASIEMKFIWLKTPELVVINQYTRPLVDCLPPSLILNSQA